MKKINYWLRWIFVFPGALIIGFLATFPLHWVLYFTLANGKTISGVNIEPIEYMLYPFVISLSFIYASYRIAPKHKLKTAIIFFGIYFIAWLSVSLLSLFKGSIRNIDIQFSWRTILALIGAIIGLYISKKTNKNINI